MKSKSTSSHPEARRIRQFPLWLSLAIGFAATLLAATAALYIERARVAALVVEHYLAVRGVDSQIEFARLNWGGLSARVRAGPIDKPDFAAESIEVTFTYPGAGFVGSMMPQVATVRLIRPLLQVTYDGKEFSFGSLQSLIDDAFAKSATGNEPAITIERGNLLLVTAYGPLNFVADAAIAKGRLEHLQASLQPSTLRGASVAADISAGTISENLLGDTANISVEIKSKMATFQGRTASGAQAALNIQGLKWKNEGAATRFTVVGADAVLNAGATYGPEGAAAESASRLVLQNVEGRLEGGRLHITMKGDVTSKLAGLRSGDKSAAGLDAQGAFSSLVLDISQAAWSADGAAHVTLHGLDAKFLMLAREMSLPSITTEFDAAGKFEAGELRGTLRGSLSTSANVPGRLAVRTLSVDFDSSGAIGKGGATGTLKASLSASGNVPRAAALDLARQIPGIGGDEVNASSISRALQAATLKMRDVTIIRSNQSTKFETRTPIVLDAMGGGSVMLRPEGGRAIAEVRNEDVTGAFGLEVQGGGLPELRLAVSSYRYGLGEKVSSVVADMQVDTSVDLGSLRGLRLVTGGKLQVEGSRIAFAAPGCSDLTLASFRNSEVDRLRNLKSRVCDSALQIANRRTVFTLRDCADVSFDSLLNGKTVLVGEAKGRLCGTMDQPIFASDMAGWRIQGGWRETSARMVAAESTMSNASGQLQLSGNDAGLKSGNITVAQASVSDSLRDPRFLPLSVTGAMSATGANWRGEFNLASSKHPLASVAVRHSMDSGAGTATIEARGLTFDPEGLQPASLA
ncbi:MAG TPA: hypothetical protein VN579_05205, partial [Bryobacteraceae bacterium]|nr:hypothetical protein [Bryobacteraceae bacterium]